MRVSLENSNESAMNSSSGNPHCPTKSRRAAATIAEARKHRLGRPKDLGGLASPPRVRTLFGRPSGLPVPIPRALG